MSARQMVMIGLILLISIALVPLLRLAGLDMKNFTLAFFIVGFVGAIVLVVSRRD